MATNRGMLKEAIAEAKAVKDMAIANAKLALEETFSPQLQELLSLKLQEMADEDLEESGFGKSGAKGDAGFNQGTFGKTLDEDGEYDDMNEIDLEELLAELENDSLNEGEEDEEEGEDMEMENLSDEDLKAAVEEVIAQMIKSGELEAGPEFGENEEEEESEEMEMSDEDEEDVDLAELLREIEEMDSIQEDFITMGGGPEITAAFALGGIGGGLIFALAYNLVKGVYNKNEMAKRLKFVASLTDKTKQKQYFDGVVKDLESNPKLAQKFQAEVDKIQSKLQNVSEAEESGDENIATLLTVLKDANIDPSTALKGSEKAEAALKQASSGEASTQNEEMEEMEEELMEARKTISILRSELNEINLLNAKLLYSNKIFKAKNLNESQKVKVLSSFDKAKNVSEVKIVFETLNEGIKIAKNPIKENLGRASKSTNTPTTKRPILESNDSFKRMQKLAGLI